MTSAVRRRRTGSIRVVGLLVAILMTSIVTTESAHAADEIGLSRDGRTFAAGLAAPLFDPTVRWVPGDVRISSVWLRNQSADPADLSVAVDADPVLQRLLDDGAFTVQLECVAVRPRCSDGQGIAASTELAPGEVVEFTVRAELVDGAPDGTQRLSGSFELAVRLTEQARVGGGVPTGPDQQLGPGTGAPDRGWLAHTGGTPAFLLAAGAVVALFALVLLARRRRGAGHPRPQVRKGAAP